MLWALLLVPAVVFVYALFARRLATDGLTEALIQELGQRAAKLVRDLFGEADGNA